MPKRQLLLQATRRLPVLVLDVQQPIQQVQTLQQLQHERLEQLATTIQASTSASTSISTSNHLVTHNSVIQRQRRRNVHVNNNCIRPVLVHKPAVIAIAIAIVCILQLQLHPFIVIQSFTIIQSIDRNRHQQRQMKQTLQSHIVHTDWSRVTSRRSKYSRIDSSRIRVSQLDSEIITDVDTETIVSKQQQPEKDQEQQLHVQETSSVNPSVSLSKFHGLSRFHLSILSRTYDKQRFVSGRYPLYVSVAKTNPTRKWLNIGRRLQFSSKNTNTKKDNKNNNNNNSSPGEIELLVNGTTPDRSLASFDRFQWIDDTEQVVVRQQYNMISMELLAEIHLDRPGYLHVLSSNFGGPGSSSMSMSTSTTTTSSSIVTNTSEQQQQYNKGDRLWVTGFSLAGRKGLLSSVNADTSQVVSINEHSASQLLWPNEVQSVPKNLYTIPKNGLIPTTSTGTGTYHHEQHQHQHQHQQHDQHQHQHLSTSIILSQSILTENSRSTGNTNQYQTTTKILYKNSDMEVLSKDDDLQFRKSTNIKIQQHATHTHAHNSHSILTTDRHEVAPPTTTTTAETTTTTKQYQDALLVSDGFLVPTKDRGGLYIVQNPGHTTMERTVRLTNANERWFYHRAVWIDLTNDGRQSIITARCKVSTVLNSRSKQASSTSTSTSTNKNGKRPILSDNDTMLTTRGIQKYGQLIWLECPKPHSYHPETGVPLESDGITVFDPFAEHHLPWKTHILATGPDVMFAIADIDPTDDTIEVISSQFFNKKISLHSIQKGIQPHVSFTRDIDTNCGAAFGCILADLDIGNDNDDSNDKYDTNDGKSIVIDSGSTVKTLQMNDAFSHVLVTSHECSYKTAEKSSNQKSNTNDNGRDGVDNTPIRFDTLSGDRLTSSSLTSTTVDGSGSGSGGGGGSLFAYRVPTGRRDAWKVDEWVRSTVASGFTVSGQLSNMINPGAPGFVYTFHSYIDINSNNQKRRPLIAVAGDCAESAYIFRPANDEERIAANTETNLSIWSDSTGNKINDDDSTQYKLMVEIDCGATVGSIGIGYGDCFNTPDTDDDDDNNNDGGFGTTGLLKNIHLNKMIQRYNDNINNKYANNINISNDDEEDYLYDTSSSLQNKNVQYAKLYIPCYEKDMILVFGLGNGDET